MMPWRRRKGDRPKPGGPRTRRIRSPGAKNKNKLEKIKHQLKRKKKLAKLVFTNEPSTDAKPFAINVRPSENLFHTPLQFNVVNESESMHQSFDSVVLYW